MPDPRRSSRLRLPVTSQKTRPNEISSPVHFTASLSTPNEPIQVIPPGSKLPNLSPTELKLLRRKQNRLAANTLSVRDSLPVGAHHRNALEASLILAQYEAGSAVCIDPAGWVLTCSHCFGDTEDEWRANKRKWLLFYNGLAVQAECRAWDSKRDLALLKILDIEIANRGKDGDIPTFRFVSLSTCTQPPKTPIICIGQPGMDDLESASNRRTMYNLVEVSEGTICGMVHGADPHDNSELGSLKHDAWTYWGHSGAPLLCKADGKLIGLHSSWDDQTTMRHGIPLIAIKAFLEQKLRASFGASLPTSSITVDSNLSAGKLNVESCNRRIIPSATDDNHAGMAPPVNKP